MHQSYCRMLIAVDVQYAELAVVTAAVGFIDWFDPSSTLECVLRAEVTPEPYEPGAFYKRERSTGTALPPANAAFATPMTAFRAPSASCSRAPSPG